MEKNTLELLEFHNILRLVSGFCVSESGKKKALSIMPCSDLDGVKNNLHALIKAIDYKDEIAGLPLDFPPLDGIFSHINSGNVLDEDGFWAISIFLKKAGKLKDFINKLDQEIRSILFNNLESIPWPGKLSQALNRCLDQNGHIKDHASPDLASIRGEIRKIQRQCTKKIYEFISEKNISDMLQDEYLTISSDRYVIALKSNFKGRIKGIVHDYSQSGETCYFEPMFLIDLNNRLQELRKTERDEINKVLKYLTSLFTEEKDKLLSLYNLMVDVDILRAKVLFAEKIRGNPVHVGENRVFLKGVRHPILFAEHGAKIEPVDIILEQNQRALILTGGNSGGKTVSLKTLGLCALMAYSGLPVPCSEGSTIPFWKDIFVFLGDEQSLHENLSTFTAQIKKIRDIWPRVGKSTLVLLDEFGAGTDPSQGAALAQAVLDCLLDKGAWIFSVTHFPSLKVYALNHENVRAATVLFDPKTKRPLYKIAYDQVGTSQALDVAKEFGMPEEILIRAREYLLIDDEKTNAVIEKLNNIAVKREQELKNLRQNVQALENEKKKLREKYEKKINELINDISKTIKEIMTSYRQQKIHRKMAQKKLKEYRERLQKEISENSAAEKVDLKDIKIGSELKYLPWSKKGIVEQINEKESKIKLNISGVSIWVNSHEVALIKSHDKKRSDSKVNVTLNYDEPSFSILDIRGKRVDEAESMIVQFLDRAIYRGLKNVEIIHGRGEGVLRSKVREILSEFPNVESFCFAPEDRGGDGVTLVTLR
ncbi:endonuclease MutS2 [Desulfothermus sp.]